MHTNLPACTVGYALYGPPGEEKVMLGTKAPTEKAVRRGIAHRLIGYGGDIEECDADPIAGFVRELPEESGDDSGRLSVDPKDVEVVAKIEVRNEARPSLLLYYLVARNVSGTARPTREILDPRLYPIDPLPENMLPADYLVLPRAFAGERLEGWLLYSADMKRVISHDLRAVAAIE